MSAYATAISELSHTRLLEECLRQRDLVERLTNEDRCDACMGTGKPISGRPCMCRGTGKMSEAALHLREQLVDREAKLDAVRERVDYYVNKPEPLGSYEQVAREVADEIRAILAAKED